MSRNLRTQEVAGDAYQGALEVVGALAGWEAGLYVPNVLIGLGVMGCSLALGLHGVREILTSESSD